MSHTPRRARSDRPLTDHRIPAGGVPLAGVALLMAGAVLLAAVEAEWVRAESLTVSGTICGREVERTVTGP